MLCILKRTAPLDGSFEYPQQFFSLVERDKKCLIHVRIQRGTGGQDTPPPPPPGKLQKYSVPLNELLLQNIPRESNTRLFSTIHFNKNLI